MQLLFLAGRLFALLPYRMQLGVAGIIGRVGGRFGGRYRRIAKTNLGICFPDHSEAQLERMLDQCFSSIGQGIAETNLSWWISPEQLHGMVEVTGREHLQQALDAGKGILLMGAHASTLEIGGRVLRSAVPFSAVYREYANPLVRRKLRSLREKHYGELVPAEDVRSFVRVLKNGGALWYLSDENYHRQNRVFAPLFGFPAATNPAPVRLAKMTGATVLPFAVRRKAAGQGYELRFFASLQNFPSGDLLRDVTRINLAVEQIILCAPEQYLWIQKRFQKRPSGEPRVYDKKKKA